MFKVFDEKTKCLIYLLSASALKVKMSRIRVALVVLGDAMLCVLLVLLVQLDQLINKTLYNYGLVFSDNWAQTYWLMLRVSMCWLQWLFLWYLWWSFRILFLRKIKNAKRNLRRQLSKLWPKTKPLRKKRAHPFLSVLQNNRDKYSLYGILLYTIQLIFIGAPCWIQS